MTTFALYITTKYPIRGSRNVPNKTTSRTVGTLADLKGEIKALIEADGFSYGTITSIQLFDWADMLADALKAKPVAEYSSPADFVGAA